MSEVKRMTLLARKPGTSTSDFRNYWAGPHAKLALGMDGISRYTHNRIDKVLWTNSSEPQFDLDGVVELYFASAEAMRGAQASAVGQKYIPEDEPVFLKGWTLCMVEPLGETAPSPKTSKVMVAFHALPGVRDALGQAMHAWLNETGAEASLNWTVGTAQRTRLWAEPCPPTGFIALRLASVAKAHEAFEKDSPFDRNFAPLLQRATAYLIDELTIR